ncbi:hypothetical protein PG987_012702 [Apiospora arundinis]
MVAWATSTEASVDAVERGGEDATVRRDLCDPCDPCEKTLLWAVLMVEVLLVDTEPVLPHDEAGTEGASSMCIADRSRELRSSQLLKRASSWGAETAFKKACIPMKSKSGVASGDMLKRGPEFGATSFAQVRLLRG